MRLPPALVAEALRLQRVDRRQAARLLHPSTTATPHLIPKSAPPRERLTLVRRADGRVLRPKARMTKELLRAGLVDPSSVKARASTSGGQP
jgi:hypothetical protein